VAAIRGPSHISPSVDQLQHPAAPLLVRLRTHGMPVVLRTPGSSEHAKTCFSTENMWFDTMVFFSFLPGFLHLQSHISYFGIFFHYLPIFFYYPHKFQNSLG
jgi:hypothetical protein